jgi:hypothetical protein
LSEESVPKTLQPVPGGGKIFAVGSFENEHSIQLEGYEGFILNNNSLPISALPPGSCCGRFPLFTCLHFLPKKFR